MSFSPEMKEAELSSCFGKLDEKESRWVCMIARHPLNDQERFTSCSCLP